MKNISDIVSSTPTHFDTQNDTIQIKIQTKYLVKCTKMKRHRESKKQNT